MVAAQFCAGGKRFFVEQTTAGDASELVGDSAFRVITVTMTMLQLFVIYIHMLEMSSPYCRTHCNMHAFVKKKPMLGWKEDKVFYDVLSKRAPRFQKRVL